MRGSLAKKVLRQLRPPVLSVIVLAAGNDQIEPTVRSVLSQPECDLEALVLVPTGSEAESVAAALAARDRRVRPLGLGVGCPVRDHTLTVPRASLLRALKQARGKSVLVLDGAQDALVAGALDEVRQMVAGAEAVVAKRRGGMSAEPFLERTACAPHCPVCHLDELGPGSVLARPGAWRKAIRASEEQVHVRDLALDLLMLAERAVFLDRELCLRRSQPEPGVVVQAQELVRVLAHRREALRGVRTVDTGCVRASTLCGPLAELALLGGALSADLLAKAREEAMRSAPGASDPAWRELPLLDRVLVHTFAYGTLQDYEELLVSRSWETTSVPLRVEAGVLVPRPPVLCRVDEPPAYLTGLYEADLRPYVRTSSVRSDEAGALVVEGWAAIKGGRSQDTTVFLEIVSDDGATQIVPVNSCKAPEADLHANDPWTSYEQAGFRACLPLGEYSWPSARFRVVMTLADHCVKAWLPAPPGMPAMLSTAGAGHWVPETGGDGELRLRRDASAGGSTVLDKSVLIGGASIVGEQLVLTMQMVGVGKPVVEAVSSKGVVGFEVVCSGKGTTVAIALKKDVLALGGHRLRWREGACEGFCLARQSLAVDTLDLRATARAARLRARADNTVVLTITPPLTVFEQSRYGRQRLMEEVSESLQEGIFFESFRGRSSADNPRAILDHLRRGGLQVPMWWSAEAGVEGAPPGALPVVTGSRDWYRAVNQARVIVTNDNLPYWFSKRPGQHLLQTWHGTTVKHLLRDAPSHAVSLPYRRLMARQVPQWDLLLAQSESAAKVLRSAFGYEGDILVGEQPRNKALLEGEDARLRGRQALALDQCAQVVLYAPTWREALRSPGRDTSTRLLDPQGLATATGATVLVRSHHMNDLRARGAGVIDVSTYPSVEELMLVADLLITDYSSIIFDWALTQKPALIHVPDLEEYQVERGLYDNWPAGCGWPVSRSQAEAEVLARQSLSQPVAPAAIQDGPVNRSLEQLESWILDALGGG